MGLGTAPVRLMIADHAPTRLGIRLAVGDAAVICAEAGDAAEAIAAADREQPEVCLVGLELPGGGLVAVNGIRAVAPSASVVVLSASTEAEDMLEFVRAGAIGYLPADIEPPALRRVLAAVARGEAALPRAMVLELAREVQDLASPDRRRLTRREAQVLEMVRRGHSTRSIADRLSISPVTVRRHISVLVQKVGVEDRGALAQVASHGAPRPAGLPA